MEESRKKGTTGYLASGHFHRLVFETSTKSKTFVISGFDFNSSSSKKKNFWGNIVSSACKELELPIASRLHGEGHGFDFQNFSHANPYVI